MGLFVSVVVHPERCPDGAAGLVGICPVDIFARGDDGSVVVVADNEDECTFCGRCVERYPTGVTIVKWYTPRRDVVAPQHP